MIYLVMALVCVGAFLIGRRHAENEFQRGFRKGMKIGLRQKVRNEKAGDNHRL